MALFVARRTRLTSAALRLSTLAALIAACSNPSPPQADGPALQPDAAADITGIVPDFMPPTGLGLELTTTTPSGYPSPLGLVMFIPRGGSSTALVGPVITHPSARWGAPATEAPASLVGSVLSVGPFNASFNNGFAQGFSGLSKVTLSATFHPATGSLSGIIKGESCILDGDMRRCGPRQRWRDGTPLKRSWIGGEQPIASESPKTLKIPPADVLSHHGIFRLRASHPEDTVRR